MYDHDHSHNKRQYVRKSRRSFEDDGVRQLDRPRVAFALDSIRAGDRGGRTHEWAEREWRLRAYVVEATETHVETRSRRQRGVVDA